MNAIVKGYKQKTIIRYDLQPHLNYFTHRDFDGLNREDISFKSAQGTTLRGGLYYYEGFNSNILVVFCHGIGGGHLSYMREIEYLCKSGFRVLAYDNTGCDSSDGENIRAMTQSVSDLNSCLGYIKGNEKLAKLRIFIVGHSWGGYAAGNILNFTDDVEKVVVMAGFVSFELLMKQHFKGILRLFLNSIVNFERQLNGKYADSSAADAYNKTKAKVLVLQSEDDPMISMQTGVGHLKQKVNNPNVRYIVVNGKKHNPNYTCDAVNYMNERFAALGAAIKKGDVKTVEDKKRFMADVDWYRMTEQDDSVWGEIIAFLKN